MRDLPNLIQLDFEASFGTMACFLERKAAPFGSRPRPMKFKMTNAVIAADIWHLHREALAPATQCLIHYSKQLLVE